MPQWGKDEEESCYCPTCERGPGPFELPCEFKREATFLDGSWGPLLRFKNSFRIRDWPLGPRIGDSKWELEYPYRTWECRPYLLWEDGKYLPRILSCDFWIDDYERDC